MLNRLFASRASVISGRAYHRSCMNFSSNVTRPLSRLRLGVLLLLCGMAMLGTAVAQHGSVGNGGPGPVKGLHVTVEMISAGPQIAAGGTQTVGFVFTLEDKWHIYWKNAGFAGFPPSVEWTLPSGVKAGDLQFPAPTRLPYQGAVDYGYEDNVTYPVVLAAGDKVKAAKNGSIHLAAKVKWLVCAEVCVPGSADLGLDLKLAPAGTVVADSGTKVGPLAAALKHLPAAMPDHFTAQAAAHGDKLALTFTTGTRETEASFFPADGEVIADNVEQTTESLPDGIRIYITLLPNTPAPKTLHGVVELTEDETYDVTADVRPGAAAEVAPPETTNGRHVAGAHAAEEVTVFSAVLLALLGGVVLNLMPCVFPVLFLKALSLVQSSGEERKRLRLHGLVYTLGIVASFWVIVAVLLLLRSGGSRFGWGFQLQSPGFVAVLAIGLFFFALSLAGLFELGLSVTSAGDSLTRKQGIAGSFFTGVLATVVATPCVGPFMGVAIGFALAQPAWVTFAVFTALGVGLALPYLAISFFPSLIRWLPKPGAWMELLKQVTALPLFATVIWLVYIYGRLFSGGAPGEGVYQSAILLTGLLIVAVGAWVLGRWPAARAATAVAVVLVALGVATPFLERPSKAEAAVAAVWQPFSQPALDAARGSGKAVFVDYTAAWCLSCQVNEKLVLNTREVQDKLRQGNFLLMRADWTQYDPAITAALTAVGRSGVPTYVIYPGKSSAAPDVLPELLTKDAVLTAITRDSK